jgi:hypothetical protein
MEPIISTPTISPTQTPAPAQVSASISSTSASSAPAICSVCHQPILPSYYFCPNCGAKLNAAPLSTSPKAQAKLYAHSIILPMLCFFTASKWRGWQYFKSSDPKTKQIGLIACILITLSTILLVWYVVIWTQQEIQSQVNSINADMSAAG